MRKSGAIVLLALAIRAFTACSIEADEPEVAGTMPLVQEHEAAWRDTTMKAFEPFATKTWAEGTTHGTWNVVFDGYGEARIAPTTAGDGKLLEIRPSAPRGPADTHAVLVRGTETFDDLDVRATMRTVAQLRPRANPWEMAWFVWHYADNDHFYYVILKPNGWELGKRDPAYRGGQRFLATGSSPTYPPGEWHTVRVQQAGATMTISADDRVLATFTDRERPYRSGSLALYTEDAVVQFDDVVVDTPPRS